jgi:hypothetical protein
MWTAPEISLAFGDDIPRISLPGLPECTLAFVTDENPRGVYIQESDGRFFLANQFGSFTVWDCVDQALAAARPMMPFA